MENFNSTGSKIVLVVGIVALVGSLGASAFLYMNKSTLEKENSQQTKQLDLLTKKIVSLESDNSKMKLQIETTSKQCESENADLKASIAAFAKQASACEAIKQKMHIKD